MLQKKKICCSFVEDYELTPKVPVAVLEEMAEQELQAA